MLSAVIPIRNEQKGIRRVISMISRLPVDLIIPVINGSSDKSLRKVLLKKSVRPTEVVIFQDSLGIDVPRAVGAKLAFDRGSDFVLFVDGDMKGNITEGLKQLITTAYEKKLDMVLTDCYGDRPAFSNPAELVLFFRRKLNEKIGLYDFIGSSSPCHGPHIVSRKLLQLIGFKPLAIPPVSLALAAKHHLAVRTGVAIPHQQLGSSTKSDAHTKMIAKTIIGDCIQALNEFEGKHQNRIFGGREYIGYHAQRNWQVLNDFLKDPACLTRLKY